MNKYYEEFFIPLPTPTDKKVLGTINPEAEHQVYLDAKGNPLRWSGDFPIPAIGDQILVKMNSIGPAIVKGYFESCGFVGVMAKPTRPPKWLQDQIKRDTKALDWQREGIGCFYGAEIEPERRST